jgi:hypothetical protein
VRLPHRRRLGRARRRRLRGTADAGGLHLRVNRVQVGEHPDPRVALGDPAQRVGQRGQPAVDLSQLLLQPDVFLGQPRGTLLVGGVTDRGVPQQEGQNSHDADGDPGALQHAIGDLDDLRGLRGVRNEHDGPAAFGHLPVYLTRMFDEQLRLSQFAHQPGSAGVTQVTGFSKLKVGRARPFVKLDANA